MQTKIIIPKILQNLQQKKVFIEPFVGGGAIIIELLKQCYLNNINNVTFYCSDINNIIIEMYTGFKKSGALFRLFECFFSQITEKVLQTF